MLSRLKGVDLGELVLDIHEGTRDRQRIAAGLGTSLGIAQQTAKPDDTSLRRRLAERQRRLNDHVTALHEAHPPWGLTPFAVQSALLGVPDEARSSVRLPAPERITGIEADEIRDELREFAHLGGFAMRPGSTPWFGAVLRTPEDAREAWQLAAQLSSYDLPRLIDRQARASAALGLRPPASYAETVARMTLYVSIGRTTASLDRAVYAANPQAIADAVAGTSGASLGERTRGPRRPARPSYRGRPMGQPDPGRSPRRTGPTARPPSRPAPDRPAGAGHAPEPRLSAGAQRLGTGWVAANRVNRPSIRLEPVLGAAAGRMGAGFG